MPAATKIPDKYKDRKFKIHGEEVVMVEHNYGNNGRLRIDFMTTGEFPEPFATLTTNLTEDDPGEDAFFVKTWSENGPLVEDLLESGVFQEAPHPTETAWKFAP